MIKTRAEYIQYHKECCTKMIDIVIAKNHDYAGFTEDPFANFKLVELCDITTTEKGLLARMMDKISRVNSFIKQDICKVTDEKIEDTLIDLANYAILLSGYIKSKKENEESNLKGK